MKKTTYMILLAATAVLLAGCKGGAPQVPGEGAGMETTQEAGQSQAPGEGAAAGTTQEAGQSQAPGEADVELFQIHEAVKKAYGQEYIPSVSFDQQAMEDIYGINKDLYQEYIGEGPKISAHVDTFIAVKAKEGKGEAVEKHLDDYRDSLLEDTMQYPSNLSKIQASQVLRKGDYVFFVMLGTPDMEAMEQGEEAQLQSAKDKNQVAIDVIDKFFT